MFKNIMYYECDVCKKEAETQGNLLSGWILLPEEKTVCPSCAEEISTKCDAEAELESARYQEALKNPVAEGELWGDFNKDRFGHDYPRPTFLGDKP